LIQAAAENVMSHLTALEKQGLVGKILNNLKSRIILYNVFLKKK
jgi:hypothetical protein